MDMCYLFVAERLSARHLILLHSQVAFVCYVCMYVCMYVHPSHFKFCVGMGNGCGMMYCCVCVCVPPEEVGHEINDVMHSP